MSYVDRAAAERRTASWPATRAAEVRLRVPRRRSRRAARWCGDRILTARVDVSAVALAGGVEGEALRPLDLSPRPNSRSRRLFSEDQVEAHLDAIESEQQQDGGWMFDWLAG